MDSDQDHDKKQYIYGLYINILYSTYNKDLLLSESTFIIYCTHNDTQSKCAQKAGY